jgi:hypothetical protein
MFFMKKEIIRKSAIIYYKENIEGEPLTEKVPIDCYIKGAEFILDENRKNFKAALKSIDPIISKLTGMEMIKIVKALRMCADLEPINLTYK